MIEYKQTIVKTAQTTCFIHDKLHGVRVDMQFDNFFFNSIM
jgi:hypothetical protein